MNPGRCDADLLHAALAEPLLGLALVLGEARVPGVLAAAGRGQRVLGALGADRPPRGDVHLLRPVTDNQDRRYYYYMYIILNFR